MHQVVPAGRVRGLGAQEFEGELAELTRKIRFVEVLERACGQVPHQHAGSQFSDLWLVAGDGPGEDVNLDASLGQSSGHLDDVDIEAACIASTWLLKRRRVNADGRDPPWVASRHWPSPPEQTNPGVTHRVPAWRHTAPLPLYHIP